MNYSDQTTSVHNMAETLNDILRRSHEATILYQLEHNDPGAYEAYRLGHLTAALENLIGRAAPDIEVFPWQGIPS